MGARLLDGRAEAQRRLQRVAAAVQARVARGLPAPGLAVVLLGEDPASATYVRNKRSACATAGIRDLSRVLPASTTQAQLLRLLAELNADPAVHGILVQLPLPPHIEAGAVLAAIAPHKDVDGFHACNLGRLAQGRPGLRPCTPQGIMALLQASAVPLAGMDAVVIGRSHIVGRPMALELIAADCTVTVCHSRTRDLPARVAAADLVVAAVGRPALVKGSWIKPGAVVIDVGIHRGLDGRLCGDVEFAAAAERAGWITPVPGGVGPMTVAALVENTLAAAEAADAGQ